MEKKYPYNWSVYKGENGYWYLGAERHAKKSMNLLEYSTEGWKWVHEVEPTSQHG